MCVCASVVHTFCFLSYFWGVSGVYDDRSFISLAVPARPASNDDNNNDNHMTTMGHDGGGGDMRQHQQAIIQ